MVYPEMNVSDTESIFTVVRYVNTVTGNLFMLIILYVIGAIIILGTTMTGKRVYRGLMYAGFVCSVISIPLVLMNFISPNYMYFNFLVTGLSIVWGKLAQGSV